MKFGKYIVLLTAAAMAACTDLDIPPKNIFGEREIFSSKEGVTSQLARIYGMLPMEDFRFYYAGSGLYNLADAKYKQQCCLTGEAVGRDTGGAEQESNSYWDGPYKAIREINLFMENLSKYSSSHSHADLKAWLAEGRFARAFVYYSLVKRYGGVILLEKAVDYPASVDMDGTKMARSSEKDSWDFIAADLKYAVDSLPATSQKGRANRYVAAAFKSRAMLHAGSVAKYTPESMKYTVDGIMLCGMDATAANGYFEDAYKSAKVFEETTAYTLHTADMGGTPTPASMATNFTNIFLKDTREHIFVRYFKELVSTHGWDECAQPAQTKTGGNSDEVCPTVDFIEMFDGLPKNASGKLEVFDASSHYKLFTSPVDFFATAEPRLRGTVIFPMDQFKGQAIEIRRGIYKRAVGAGLDPLAPEGHIANYSSLGNGDLYLGQLGAAAISLSGGGSMSPVGKSGIATNWDFGNISGMYCRKYLDPTAGRTTNGNVSTTSWIEIRYAEVLLNLAEAAYELYSAGQATASTGENYRNMAFQCINGIRQRAGATLLANDAAINDIEIIRTERRKELAFEGKTYWDLKRWRVIHLEQNNRRYRTLQPFYSDNAGKYFLDVHFQEARSTYSYIYTYDTRYYYQPIPGGEITKNPNCKQNNGY